MQISNMAFHFVIGTRYNHSDELDTLRARPLISDIARYQVLECHQLIYSSGHRMEGRMNDFDNSCFFGSFSSDGGPLCS